MDVDSAIETHEFEVDDFENFLDALLKEIELANYRVLKVANVDNIEDRKGLVKDIKVGFKIYKIVEFCNLFTCSKMADADFRVGVFLPQRFAVYQPVDEETIYVSYLRPTALAEWFKSEEMMKTASILEKEMADVLEAVED